MKNLLVAIIATLTLFTGSFATHSFVKVVPAGNPNGNELSLHKFQATSHATAKLVLYADTTYGVSDSSRVNTGYAQWSAALNSWDFLAKYNYGSSPDRIDRVTTPVPQIHADSIVCFFAVNSNRLTPAKDSFSVGIKYKTYSGSAGAPESTYAASGRPATYFLPVGSGTSYEDTVVSVSTRFVWGMAYTPWIAGVTTLLDSINLQSVTCSIR